MAEFSLNTALKNYLDSPDSIATPDAHSVLLECENDSEAYNSGHASDVFNEMVDALEERPEAVSSESHLDSLQYLLKQSAHIPLTWLRRICDLVISGLGATAESIHDDENDTEAANDEHKQVLEIYGFLLQWGILAIETQCSDKSQGPPARTKPSAKGAKGKNGAQKDATWDPSQQLQVALDTIGKVMKLKISRMFVTTSERDTFISLFTRPTYLLLESETRIKNTSLRMHAFKVLCIAIKHHGHAYGAQTSIIQNLTYFEHLAEPMAEFLNILAEQYDLPQLAEEVMKELSGKQFSASDTKGPKSVSAFVTRLSELMPRVVQRQVSYLAKLLESENYSLRCAIIEVCGNLITMLSQSEEGERGENHKAQINAFFDVLEDRFLDINPYCRCRAIQVFSKLCELETKYPKRRQTAAELATRSLEDKSSNVRRNAIKLLSRLLATHPFALLHGGLLSYRDWQDRLEACEAEINHLQPPADIPGLAETSTIDKTIDESLLDEPTQVEGESSEQNAPTEEEQAAALARAQEDAATSEAMSKLQLTRRYYVEALRFIVTLHEASVSVVQLLGSKNKSEVIEAMDFFVMADAYHLDSAKKGIRRMLRLIWTKGNSDEGKGVQSHLVSCYKGLFFDAPSNFTPNDAANYIARNMISLTFGATSAELTSLEQLLATMMKEGAVGELVVQKLWQVYGVQRKEISKQQRRGTIIVLGMLALAEPQIIVREMESCLRIGLGAMGRQDLVLARYTCVALMRMTESKVSKGQQAKTDSRLPNEHAVLQQLAELICVDTENRDWYGLAEQATGAIYALSVHPDVLCSIIIRRKTRSVFASTPARPATRETTVAKADDEGDIGMSDVVDDGDINVPEDTDRETADPGKDASGLSQLLFLVGHAALKQIVHLELCEKDFKRRKADNAKPSATPTSTNKNRKAKPSGKSSEAKNETAEDELDLMAGTNEDDFAEAIAHIRERELLYGPQSLLRTFGPLVAEVCGNNTLYANAELQSQGALCMAKLMCVSSEYCETNLGLFITILERSTSPIIRSNLVVALADMAVCFNHLIDENTDYLYRRLADHSLLVKRTCLMTLTFLILAGQVKVKGQLGDMAKCIEDPDERIREMSRMFFGELAVKDNAIYNHFVDMFSILSMDAQLDEAKFHRIIRFLTSFIEKDKHAKQLASKLAPRLARAESERQWNDIAFTIGLLPHKNEDITKLIADGCKLVGPTP